LTRIPNFAYSRAAAFVKPTTPCFAEAYAALPGRLTIIPATDDVFTIAPPPRFNICGISCFMHSQTPLRFTFISRSQSSSVQSAIRAKGVPTAPPPALLKAQSSPPYVATAVLTIASTCSVLVTSHWTYIPSPPVSSIARRVLRKSSAFRLAMTTFAPSAANANAAALPIPELPPVMSTTLSSKDFGIYNLFAYNPLYIY